MEKPRVDARHDVQHIGAPRRADTFHTMRAKKTGTIRRAVSPPYPHVQTLFNQLRDHPTLVLQLEVVGGSEFTVHPYGSMARAGTRAICFLGLRACFMALSAAGGQRRHRIRTVSQSLLLSPQKM